MWSLVYNKLAGNIPGLSAYGGGGVLSLGNIFELLGSMIGIRRILW